MRAVVAGAAVLAGVLATAGHAGARPDVTRQPADEGAFVADVAAVGSVGGERPSVSGDGRFVAFEGAPPAPAEGAAPDDRASTIWLADRDLGGFSFELTAVPDGLRAGDSIRPVVSGDGCSVVVVTQLALDVFRDDDTGERWDVYRTTLPHCGGALGDWELISSRADGSGLARDDVTPQAPALSRSGTAVAYTHPADHLYQADGITTISLVDVTVPVDDPGRTRFVAGSPADSPVDTYVHAGLDQPVLSGDGRYLAYRSDATSAEAVPGWAPGLEDGGPAVAQVYVWEIAQLDPFTAVQLVSRAPDGSPSPTGAAEPDLSRDGMVVAFTSTSPLVADATFPPCPTGCPRQVYVVERDAGGDGVPDAPEAVAARLVSRRAETAPAVAGGAPSHSPSVSGDGQLVAFTSSATDLLLVEPAGVGGGDDGDLLLAELRHDRLSRLSERTHGVLPTQGVHAHPDLSDSGRAVVFDTAAGADLLFSGALPGRQIVARTSDPQLSLADADLGTTLVGVEGDEWYVAVINDGPSSFRPTSVTMSNTRFSINEEKSSCLIASTVPAGGSCTVAVSFTPKEPGWTMGTLTVAEEGFGAVSVSSQVAGSGGNPALRIAPAGADLGVVTVGEPSTEFQFDLSNISFTPIEITSFEITGEQASDFAFSTNNCAFRPVNPEASCSVGITFTPSDQGRRTALVELTTRDGQYTTMVIAGDGEFAPEVHVDALEVRAGGDLVARGSQYPPSTEVVVVFGDGPGASITTTTDETGAFEVVVPVDLAERGGERRLVVQSTSGAAAAADVEVVPDDPVPVGLPGFGLG